MSSNDIMSSSDVLKSRLRSCLQIIIELEPVFLGLEKASVVLEEFETLKRVLKGIDNLSLTEEDVERVESSTRIFLKEIATPVQTGICSLNIPHRLQ